MLYKAPQLIAAGAALEKKRSDDRYEESGARNRFIEALLPLLTKFNAVYVLENIEIPIASDNLNAKFQQAPQRRNRTAKKFVVQSSVAKEGFRVIAQGWVLAVAHGRVTRPLAQCSSAGTGLSECVCANGVADVPWLAEQGIATGS
jgi:hypothetical protein